MDIKYNKLVKIEFSISGTYNKKLMGKIMI